MAACSSASASPSEPISASMIQAQVGGHLVVARAAGVQLAGHRADQLAQAPLDGGVDVLVAGLEAAKAPASNSTAYLLQAGDQLRRAPRP